MSAITPIPHDKTPNLPQLWIWASFELLSTVQEFSLDAVNDLIETGWMQASSTGAVSTQLYETKGLMRTSEESMDVWYKPTNNPLRPVTLAFSIDSQPQPEEIPMLNPLPVPQIGEYAFVEDDNSKLSIYYIQLLPLDARQRWVLLGEEIKKLSHPCLWPPFTERHVLASDELTYNREIAALTTQQKLAISAETKANFIIKGARLMAAHAHIEDLRKMLRKANWLEQWQEVQRMVQELASDYYEYHQQHAKPTRVVTTPISMASIPAQTTTELEQKKRRTTRKGTTTGVTFKDKEEISVSAHTLNRELINALRNKEDYKLYPDHGVAEHKHKFSKDKGQIIIAISPSEGEGWETVLHAINTLGDECIDTYIATMAIAIEKNGTDPDRIRTPFRISPDAILEYRKKVKSNGSYTPFQRAEVIKQLKTLSQARVIATMPGPRRRIKGKMTDTTIRAEGAIIDLHSFKIGEYQTITGEEVWSERSISMGEWVNMIPGLSKQTATMLRQVLAYSAKNGRYQKRLGIYLTFMFRINAQRGGIFPNDISMEALLDGAGIIPDKKRPGEFKHAIERALECLKRDNVVGDYWQVVDSTPQGQESTLRIQEQAYGWINFYLQQKWNFSPPDNLKKQYKNLLKDETESDVDGEQLV